MKRVTLGLLCLIGVMSCDIPRSITLKGNPGVYLPLGSPFSRLDDADKLENQISSGKVKEMLGKSETDNTNKARVYDYQGSDVDPKVQAYIVHYPIVEMKLDLEEYIGNAAKTDDDGELSHTIEANIGNSSYFSNQFPQGAYLTGKQGPKPAEDPNDPLFRISLADMAKLVKEVTVIEFGLEMTYNNDRFADYVRIKIPAFGITDYIPGEKSGNTLRFVNAPANKFIPKPQSKNGTLNEKSEIEIFVKVTGPCSGTIVPQMVFNWTSAIIYAPQDNPIKGTHTIQNKLGEFLGEGSRIKKAAGHIYVNDIEKNEFKASISITAAGSDLVSPNTQIKPKPRPSFPDSASGLFEGSLPLDSLDKPDGIVLTAIINSNGKLEYTIKVEEMTITPADKEKTIAADLVVLFPLEFSITNSARSQNNDDYVKLGFGDKVFDKLGKDDWFSRTGDGDDFFEYLDMVKILIRDVNNTIIDIDTLALRVETRKDSQIIEFNKKDLSLKITGDDIRDIPFNPRFTMLLRKDANGNSGTLKILRPIDNNPPAFNFKLDVEATAKVNYTIDL